MKKDNCNYRILFNYLLKNLGIYLLLFSTLVCSYEYWNGFATLQAILIFFVLGYFPLAALFYGVEAYNNTRKIFIPSLIFVLFFGIFVLIEYVVCIACGIGDPIAGHENLFTYIYMITVVPSLFTLVVSCFLSIVSAFLTKIYLKKQDKN